MAGSGREPLNVRSLLFVPAHRADFVARAAERGADAVILDLEDGAPASARDMARDRLADNAAFLMDRGARVVVRINPLDVCGREDIAAVLEAGVSDLMAPKMETASQVLDLAAATIGNAAPSLLLSIETPAGILALRDIVAAAPLPRLAGLAFGGEDLAARLGVSPSCAALRGPAQMVALAAAAVGRPAFGLPGPLAALSDLSEFAAAARCAAALGLSGAMCIAPRQVEIVNAAFSPAPEHVQWAQRVLSSPIADGAARIGDEMIDAPIRARARAILARSSRTISPRRPSHLANNVSVKP